MTLTDVRLKELEAALLYTKNFTRNKDVLSIDEQIAVVQELIGLRANKPPRRRAKAGGLPEDRE